MKRRFYNALFCCAKLIERAESHKTLLCAVPEAAAERALSDVHILRTDGEVRVVNLLGDSIIGGTDDAPGGVHTQATERPGANLIS